ncbi:MAG: ribbon-helix-helix domain-containing protein [Alphaproteobacteria bacterium]|nr:ribbon-helix-helix domain-containing protein [Alphaproteobacteria bacterium]
MKKISVVIAGRHANSICLEDEILSEVKRIDSVKSKSFNDLVTEIDSEKKTNNLSSAIRLFVLKELKNK